MTETVTLMARIKLAAGVTEAQFLEASDRFHREFAGHQPGLIRRELVGDAEGGYLDIVQFRSKEDAEATIEREKTSSACQAFFSIMDVAAADGSDGITFYRSLATYGQPREG